MKLGVIADDFTGATDIAGFLVEYGIPTIQINGVPDPSFRAEAVEDMPLVTGGSGLAMGLAQRQHKEAAAVTAAPQVGRPGEGKTVVLSGSCS